MKIRLWHLLAVALFLSLILWISPFNLTLQKSFATVGVIYFSTGIIILFILILNHVIIDTNED